MERAGEACDWNRFAQLDPRCSTRRSCAISATPSSPISTMPGATPPGAIGHPDPGRGARPPLKTIEKEHRELIAAMVAAVADTCDQRARGLHLREVLGSGGRLRRCNGSQPTPSGDLSAGGISLHLRDRLPADTPAEAPIRRTGSTWWQNWLCAGIAGYRSFGLPCEERRPADLHAYADAVAAQHNVRGTADRRRLPALARLAGSARPAGLSPGRRGRCPVYRVGDGSAPPASAPARARLVGRHTGCAARGQPAARRPTPGAIDARRYGCAVLQRRRPGGHGRCGGARPSPIRRWRRLAGAMRCRSYPRTSCCSPMTASSRNRSCARRWPAAGS